MTTDVVPTSASGDSIAETLWFRFVVRAVLVLLALWMLSFAANRYDVFFTSFVRPFDIDSASWLVWLAAMIGAGLLFGLAALAAVRQGSLLAQSSPPGSRAPVPARSILVGIGSASRRRVAWKQPLVRGDQIQFVLAAFAGVALASAFQAKRSSRRPE